MNLPTRVTVARIALIPIFVLIFCLREVFEQYYILMTIVFIIASCTDFVDGHLARKHNLVTDLGKFLDPIADKILVVAGMIVLLKMNFITATGEVYPVLAPYFGEICVILILAREFIIGVFRQLAASKGKVMAADKLGKAKTIITLIALPMLMLVPFINEPWHKAVNWVGVVFLFLGWVLFGVATILTVVSGFNYIWKNRHVFIEEKNVDNAVVLDANVSESKSENSTDNNVVKTDNIDIPNEKESEND
ncbi:MAG: CDP-diacylglycerol--glycerol-3-phosphate 3-phosphatidyltransferase [Clostridia bacterium]|nr:CDP-diacylglycerol--glycerol-3-phosphate 3-phosphatidyltransferase [Clostridia bacterium]